MTSKDFKKLLSYWVDSSDQDWKTHLSLVRSHHWGPSLFYLQLSMERLLKAIVVKQTREQAPFNHNLVYLLGRTNLVLSNELIQDLAGITEFNMTVRYPSDVQRFHQSATKKFVTVWQQKAKVLRERFLLAINAK